MNKALNQASVLGVPEPGVSSSGSGSGPGILAASEPRVARGAPSLVSGRPWASRGTIAWADEFVVRLDSVAVAAAVVWVRLGEYSVSISAPLEGCFRFRPDDGLEWRSEPDPGLEPEWIGVGGPLVPAV